MHVHQSLKGIVIAQVSECPSLMVKPTFCGQTRKVGNVPESDIQAFQFSGMRFLIVIRYSALSASSGLPWNSSAKTVTSSVRSASPSKAMTAATV